MTLHVGDCLDVLPGIADASVDAIVTDPPYSLSFMGREWDKFKPPAFQAWCEKWAAECLRVLKPGGHLLAFGGTRTYHRLACGIEDAGFEVRDSLHWIYGSGFPKSLDVSKAIDRAAGAEREVTGPAPYRRGSAGQSYSETRRVRYDYQPQPLTAPATEAAARWEGWGTALKPAHEPIIVARKPFAGTVAANVLEHGTGALNVDGCRVTMSDADRGFILKTARPNSAGQEHVGGVMNRPAAPTVNVHTAGRWPPNVLLGPEAAEELDRQAPAAGSFLTPGRTYEAGQNQAVYSASTAHGTAAHDAPGGASRFFPVFRYQAKASSRERPRLPDGTAHPTVKPVDLMRWLVRLVTPPGGLVCDPFAGSGTTGEAAILEGFRYLLIERDPASAGLIRQRLSKPLQPSLGG